MFFLCVLWEGSEIGSVGMLPPVIVQVKCITA
jgi:hypothetical protein